MEKNLDINKGQHLLINKEVIKKEIEAANLSSSDFVIEVGAGSGNLTEKIAEKAGKVLAFEIDDRYKEQLNALQEENKNLVIIFGNAFEHSWKNYNKVVSNIPYFVSDQLINKAIKEKISEIVIIAGENLKNKLENRETKIGFIANLFYNTEFLEKVDKKNFHPIPRVNSWLLTLKRKKEKQLSKIDSILASIINKNGKIKNAILYSLISIGGNTKKQAKKLIEQMQIHKETLEKPVASITGKFLLRVEKELKKLI